MAWNRRVIYRLSDGMVLSDHQEQGDILEMTLAEELAFQPSLAGVDISTVGEFHWTSPDAAVEAEFASKVLTGVDISVTPHTLVFSEPPLPEPVQTDRDYIIELEDEVLELNYQMVLAENGVTE